jgi:hypothetical protein
MDFFAVGAILIIYYIRPQDWVPGLAGANLIQPIAMIAVMSVILRRRTRLPERKMMVPHDWLMLAYGGYIIFTSPNFNEALSGFLPLAIFYWVTVESLDSERRIGIYLRLWLAMMLAVAGIAVMSLFGFDLTGAVEVTESFKGRLAIGTWIHGNPNSLGHTVIVALPACYCLMVWRHGLVRRLQALPLMAMAAYCVYCAQSRGAFVAGIILVAFALVLGRGLIVRAFVIVFLVTGATAVLSSLPRMNEDFRSDEGVQGRIMAWEIARTASRRELTGEGWKEFQAYISYEGQSVKKATHSCYVRVAADLGYPGLFLYLSILWFSLRSVSGLRSSSNENERIRRTVMVIAVGYVISGWMIDRAYYVEFFLIAAVSGALHRLKVSSEGSGADLERADGGDVLYSGVDDDSVNRYFRRGFGLADVCVSLCLTYATLRLWDYILNSL